MSQLSSITLLCSTLYGPMDYSMPGSPVHGIFQARILDGLPFPSARDCPDPEIKPGSPTLQADALPSEPPGKLRLVIAFLSRSKCLNFMVAVTICSDFGTPKSKVSHCFHFFPSICSEVMGLDAMIFVF